MKQIDMAGNSHVKNVEAVGLVGSFSVFVLLFRIRKVLRRWQTVRNSETEKKEEEEKIQKNTKIIYDVRLASSYVENGNLLDRLWRCCIHTVAVAVAVAVYLPHRSLLPPVTHYKSISDQIDDEFPDIRIALYMRVQCEAEMSSNCGQSARKWFHSMSDTEYEWVVLSSSLIAIQRIQRQFANCINKFIRNDRNGFWPRFVAAKEHPQMAIE